MKTLITAIQIMVYLSVANAKSLAGDLNQPTVDSLASQTLLEAGPLQELPIRSLSSKDGSRLFVESSRIIKDVKVEIQCSEGNIYLSYNMPVLSEADLSLNILPEGTYYCYIRSDEGLFSSKLERSRRDEE